MIGLFEAFLWQLFGKLDKQLGDRLRLATFGTLMYPLETYLSCRLHSGIPNLKKNQQLIFWQIQEISKRKVFASFEQNRANQTILSES